MNPKQLKRVVIVLAVAVVFWLVAELLGGSHDDSETALVLPALQMSDVDAITIQRPEGTVALARVGESSWTVNGYRVAEDMVQDLFAGLVEASEAELVATGSTVHRRMGIDSTAGTFMRFENGGEQIAAVVFGKQGSAYSTRYVRLDGQDFVYRYSGQLTAVVDRNEDAWRDKTILDIAADSVGRVVARRSEGGYTLNRAENGWVIGRGGAADSAAVQRMLTQYSSLQASGFATGEQVDSVDFTRPDRSITLLGLQGDTLAAMAFDSTASAYWVQVASDSIIYRVLQWKANQMVPVDSTLRAQDGGR
jgi:hypothetical protein